LGRERFGPWPFGVLAGVGQPGGEAGTAGDLSCPPGWRANVLALEGDGGAGAQRQGGLALLHGVVALALVVVGRDAEVGVEAVEGVLGVDGGQGPLQGAVGLGLVG
jgi:hypothetical protein